MKIFFNKKIMEKSLEQWKKEIDAWIARWRADFKAGNYYESNDDFFQSIKKEVIQEKRNNSKISFLFANKKEWVLV